MSPIIYCDECNGHRHSVDHANSPSPRYSDCPACDGAGWWEGDWRTSCCDTVMDVQHGYCANCEADTVCYAGASRERGEEVLSGRRVAA